jgi:hypothetical protein
VRFKSKDERLEMLHAIAGEIGLDPAAIERN